MKKILVVLLVVIVTSLLAGSGVYWWQKTLFESKSAQQTNNLQTELTQSQQQNKTLQQTLLEEATLRIQTQPITPAKNYSSDVVQDWIDLMLVLTKETPGFTPPVAARAFGYTGVSLYESVRFGIPSSKSLSGQVNGFEPTLLSDINTTGTYDWRLVANSNLATTIRLIYTNASEDNKAKIDSLEKDYMNRYSQGINEKVVADSIALGKTVAEHIINYANSDGQATAYAANFPTTFQPPVGEGLWVPTPDAFQAALQPYWGNVRPFLDKDIAETLPLPPPSYSLEPNSQFYKEVKEVYDTVKNITDEQKTIALFWSDDPGKTATPPGHSISILKQALKQQNSSLDTAAIAFAKVGMGAHDSFVACWYAKFKYNLIRPVTVIQKNIDPTFKTLLNTPPFPEYPSGHSVQSGTAAQILTDLFGENYHFTDTTNQNRTDIKLAPRSFNSFDEFAKEAAISRLYGGIHFRSAIEHGLAQGQIIGKNISSLSFSQ